MDREKIIKEFEHLLNAARGNYFDFVDLTVDEGEEILALLKERESVEHALEVLKANGWKKTRQRDIYSDETYSVIKKKA